MNGAHPLNHIHACTCIACTERRNTRLGEVLRREVGAQVDRALRHVDLWSLILPHLIDSTS